MKRLSLVPLVVAVLILTGIGHLNRNPQKLEFVYDSIVRRCQEFSLFCLSIKDMLRDIKHIAHDVRRAKVNTRELPILNIHLSDGALRKFERKRQQTISKPRPILIVEDDDWASATVIVDDGRRKQKAKIRLRLKGDWADHLKGGNAPSFRIKVRDGKYIFGMKRFSIQHPSTRLFLAEPLVHEQMRELGILAPRYFFVDVRINGYIGGVMAVEEHFAKELVESQSRREGPILAIDEDLLWRQWDLNYNVNRLARSGRPNIHDKPFKWSRDLRIKEFRSPSYAPGTIATNNTIRAKSLLRDYLDGRIPQEDVFDLKRLSRWWLIANVWHGCHGVIWHNRRFFFNTVTNRLEPISFDNNPSPRNYRPCNLNSIGGIDLGTSKTFLAQLVKDARLLKEKYSLPSFKQGLAKRQEQLNRLLKISKLQRHEIKTETLLANLEKFTKRIEAQLAAGGKVRDWREKWFEISSKPLLESNAVLAAHLTAYIRGGSRELQLRNLTLDPIEITGIHTVDRQGRKYGSGIKPFTLAAYGSGKAAHVKALRMTSHAIPHAQRQVVAYRFRNQFFEQTIYRRFNNHETGFARDFIARVASISERIVVDDAARSITFPEGDYAIDESFQLPRNWSVTFEAGASIHLKHGALLKIQGRLHSAGTRQRPVRISIESDLDRFGMGAWGGIFVVNAERKSRLLHTIITGTRTQNLRNRQDYFGLTGCVTFYNSPVNIRDTQFTRMQCEDALNIISSPFSLRNVSIRDTRADGFDSDFSSGAIAQSDFAQVGNDGIDVSGTNLDAIGLTFNGIGDKAISVGERSKLTAKDLMIESATTGVASKDLSSVKLRKARFANISGTVLMTYIKKSEYGPAKIACDHCAYESVNKVLAQQPGCTITLNGHTMKSTHFTRRQLIEAGFIAG